MGSLKLFCHLKQPLKYVNNVNNVSSRRLCSSASLPKVIAVAKGESPPSKAEPSKAEPPSQATPPPKEPPKEPGSSGACRPPPEFIPICDPLGAGKAVTWDEKTKKLFFVDVPASTVYSYDIKCGQCHKAKVCDEPLIFMFPTEVSDKQFIAGLVRKFALVEWDQTCPKVGKVEIIQEVDCEPDKAKNIMNGSKVDPWKRLWTGTMGPVDMEKGTFESGKGSLYSLTKGTVKKVLEGLGVPSGMAWNTKTMKMYMVDSCDRKVYEFDFDGGKICNKKCVFDFKPNCLNGRPWGLTCDVEGNLWVCSFMEGLIVRFCPVNKKIIYKLKVPTPQVTSVCFGGENYDLMFVTTAALNFGGKKLCGPAGTTFMVKNIPVIGCPSTRYNPC